MISKRLYNVINLNSKSQFDLLFFIIKKYPSFHGSYFVIIVNAPNQHSLFSFIRKNIEILPLDALYNPIY
jgi:hypothetical protein